MIQVCEKCKSTIEALNFTEEQMLEIYGFIANDLKLFAVRKMMDDFKLGHKEAKIIVAHMNYPHGACVNCDFTALKGENAECPQCKSFNYNLKEPLFNKEFCTHLEWKLNLKDLDIKSVQNFWCDGIDNLPVDFKCLSVENIQKTQVIQTKAWIGNDGQKIYSMKINLGKQSLENYKNGWSLIKCIPEDTGDKWITIDEGRQEIEIDLE